MCVYVRFYRRKKILSIFLLLNTRRFVRFHEDFFVLYRCSFCFNNWIWLCTTILIKGFDIYFKFLELTHSENWIFSLHFSLCYRTEQRPNTRHLKISCATIIRYGTAVCYVQESLFLSMKRAKLTLIYLIHIRKFSWNNMMNILRYDIRHESSCYCGSTRPQHDSSHFLEVGISLDCYRPLEGHLYESTWVAGQAPWILFEHLSRSLVKLSFELRNWRGFNERVMMQEHRIANCDWRFNIKNNYSGLNFLTEWNWIWLIAN